MGHPAWFEPDEWLGGRTGGDEQLHLLSDQPDRKLHSQLDASSYSRAGKVDGRERVHLNPDDAAARGIAEGDVVELWNDRGACLASAHINPQIMQGVARLATGAWYDPDDTGRDRHGNPNVLTMDKGTSSLAQGSIAQWGALKAEGVDMSGPLQDYRRKRDRIFSGLCDAGYEVERPGGAFYIFPKAPFGTGTEFVSEAIKRNLLVIPGDVFSRKDSHFRISYAASDETIENALTILASMT